MNNETPPDRVYCENCLLYEDTCLIRFLTEDYGLYWVPFKLRSPKQNDSRLKNRILTNVRTFFATSEGITYVYIQYRLNIQNGDYSNQKQHVPTCVKYKTFLDCYKVLRQF